MKLEILCTTMNQTDFSKIKSMNIQSNVLFTNQAGRHEYSEYEWNGYKARMITTNTIGVGINRNLGLLYSKGDILLFADDDFLYDDNVEENVLKAFEDCPKADAVIFGSRYSKNGEIYYTRQLKREKLPIYNSMKFGTCVIAIKREAVLRKNLRFINLFGGGCIYSHGEDSDFILQCYKNKLKLYTHEYILGTTAKDTSTCFSGYNEKYFYDRGALAKNSFGIFGRMYMLYTYLKMRKKAEITPKQMRVCMRAGYKNYTRLKSFKEWVEGD